LAGSLFWACHLIVNKFDRLPPEEKKLQNHGAHRYKPNIAMPLES